jgi:hypothetical protein
MMYLVVDRLDDLAHPGQPAAQLPRPGVLAMPFRRANDLRPIAVPPARVRCPPLKALIADIRTRGGFSYTQAAGVRLPTQRKEGLGQGLILSTGGSEAKTGDHPP